MFIAHRPTVTLQLHKRSIVMEFTLICASFYAKSVTYDITSLTVVFTEEDLVTG